MILLIVINPRKIQLKVGLYKKLNVLLLMIINIFKITLFLKNNVYNINCIN